MTISLRGFPKLQPALFLLYDPAEKYTRKALERAKYAPRVLVGGSKDVTREDAENMIDELVNVYRVDKSKIYLFPGHESQLTPKAHGVFLPACIPNSKNPENLGPRQERAMPLLKQLYGDNVEKVWYYPHGGDAFEVAECRKTTEREEYMLFDKWTRKGDFEWYYQEGGSGQEMIPLHRIRKCFEICKKRGKKFIVGGGIRTYEQAKTLRESGINFIVISNAQLEPWGPYEIKKIQTRLYTARDIATALAFYNWRRRLY
ncbi:MAG: geranylgeranylglyceryl/heptaprenylglyceryl phosphate synthase [Candidatus Aenigmarchaeota archaeon]|nr:geranylgeranylglyceryl/heptaprenylglyceryl phosphate synthase [Candidatus Aenigmarchaeota archaeon]